MSVTALIILSVSEFIAVICLWALWRHEAVQLAAIAVLIYLQGNSLSGRELRGKLCESGIAMGPVQFYSMMSNLEDKGMIHSHNRPTEVGGQSVTETIYYL